jgi:hypothetical protein
MRRETYEWLLLLYGRYGPREFGKLSQKLLALTYRRAGYTHVVERGVQGVDVDAARGQAKFATEVKTTINNSITILSKDVRGLAARSSDGYKPLLGVLRLSPLSDWFLADAEYLKAGCFALDQLRSYRRHDLEDDLRPLFAVVVEEHADAALVGAQTYLDGVLNQMGIVRQE